MIEKQYLSNRVLNANDAQLVAILYEGLIENLKDGMDYINAKAYIKLNANSQKNREIVAELLSTLQGNSEIAKNLRGIYLYVNTLITEGENKKDSKKLQEAIKVITPVYEAWEELGKKEAANKPISKPTGPAIVAGMTYGKGKLNDYVLNNSGNRWEKG